jgi:hypothetical protein
MPDPAPPAKLYVVVDEELSPGQQLAQATHAAFQLSVDFPEAVSFWHAASNYLVVLSHPHPEALLDDPHLPPPNAVVREPDFPGDPVTAVAWLPRPDVTDALRFFPLALKERVVT